MKPSFWKALEALGASGSALCSWRHHLGADWDACAPFLSPTGNPARCVIDRRNPRRTLELMVDGDEDFVAVDEDFGIPPIPFKAAEVAEMKPRWESIARALADTIGFDNGTWEHSRNLRRIGSCQDPFGRVSPVLLFLPPGHLGDYQGLFRELSMRTESTVLFPTHRWFTSELEALRVKNHLEFVDLAERLVQIEARSAVRVALPVINKSRGPAQTKTRAVIHAGNGLTWSQVCIEVTGNQTIHLKAPGQEGTHSFSKRNQLGPEHPLGILMALAAKGQWRNPPVSSRDYERVSKAFQRLQYLLRTIVPLPDKPFRKSTNFFLPAFKIRIHPKLLNDADKVNY